MIEAKFGAEQLKQHCKTFSSVADPRAFIPLVDQLAGLFLEELRSRSMNYGIKRMLKHGSRQVWEISLVNASIILMEFKTEDIDARGFNGECMMVSTIVFSGTEDPVREMYRSLEKFLERQDAFKLKMAAAEKVKKQGKGHTYASILAFLSSEHNPIVATA